VSRCPQCQHDNPGDAKFCLECGLRLVLECLACGTQLPGGSKFCKECGRPVALAPAGRFGSPESYTPKHLAERILTSKAALEGERKQVTVLFADVVGFSTLSERLDPEAIHTIMDGCFEILSRAVHRYEGTINQFTGDGIMALFGAPITHEDHAIRALQAALAIQTDVAGYGDAVQRRFGLAFQMRIGVNTAPSSWAGLATTSAWTTPPRATPRTSRPGSSRWPRPGRSGWANPPTPLPGRPLSGARSARS
jgi:hypothetical protein